MVLKCDKCSFTARFNWLIKKHILGAHTDPQPWSCTFPGFKSTFTVKESLTRHRRIHETRLELRKPYPCTFANCDYRASLRSTLATHVKGKHTPGRVKAFQCPLCPSKFHGKLNLDLHIQGHVKEKRFKCKYCNFKTHINGYISLHVKAKHEKSTFFHCQFPGCDYRSPFPGCVKRHRKIHYPDEKRPPRTLIPCNFPECPYQTSSMSCLKGHILTRHNPNCTRDFNCPMCPKKFFHASGLRMHITGIHARQKQFKCSSCSYVTEYMGNLKRHFQRVHEGVIPEKKFKCDLCVYRGTFKRDMDMHRLTVHSEIRKFQCRNLDCNYKTNEAGNFKTHLLTHEENPLRRRPFACSFPECDFRTRTSTAMKCHEEQHSSKKLEFRCKLCPNKSYPDSISLHYHQCMTHNKKSFNCSICNACVSSKGVLKNHMRKLHSKSNSTDQEVVPMIPRKETGRRGKCDLTSSSQINRNKNDRNFASNARDSDGGGSAIMRNPVSDRILIIVLDKIEIEKL